MKKAILAVTLMIGLAAATPALAQSSGSSGSSTDNAAFYAFGGVGWANMGINQAELDAASAAVGNAVPSTLVNTATGYTFGAGYQFNRYVGAEFSYINFNTLSYDNPSPGPTVGVDFMPRSYNLFAVGTVPLGSHFAVYGKAGVAFTRLTANTNELQVYSTTANATKAAFGGGIEAIFNKNFSVRGEYTYFGTIGDPPDFTNNLGTGTGTLGIITVSAVIRIPTR